MRIKTTKSVTADYLDSPEAIEALLGVAFETNGTALITAPLGEFGKANGMDRNADQSGLSRESLCGALSANGNPGFDAILKVLCALGITLAPRLQVNSESAIKDLQIALFCLRRFPECGGLHLDSPPFRRLYWKLRGILACAKSSRSIPFWVRPT